MKLIDSLNDFPIKLDISSDNSFYNVYLSDSINSLNGCFFNYQLNEKKICVITDSNVYQNCSAEKIFSSISKEQTFIYEIKPGESSKSDETVKSVIRFLLENNFNRDDLLIAFGGGVITDLTGFIAAIYKRGIEFISIPTSLVSMTDSSIGGKNGINFLGYKNEIGTFKNPLLVYINTDFIMYLQKELIAEGLVEIIKSALVYDCEFYKYIIDNIGKYIHGKQDSPQNKLFFANLIYNSVLIKSAIVSEDPYDMGLRHLLNFGHTIGHSIEKCCDYRISHGQAVAIGIISSIKISKSKGLLNDNIDVIISDIFTSLGLPVSISQVRSKCTLDSCMADLEENILYYIGKDKKQSANGLKFVLLEAPGRGIICNKVTEGDILGSL